MVFIFKDDRTTILRIRTVIVAIEKRTESDYKTNDDYVLL